MIARALPRWRAAAGRALPSAAAALFSAAALGAVSPTASAEVLRPGCAAFGTYDGAHHPGACWRPFSPTSPFNVRLQPNDPRTVPNSARIVSRLNGFGKPLPLEFGPGKDGEGRGTKALYFSTAADPVYTVRFTEDSRNGGSWGRHPVNGMRVRIPDGARPAMETDRHMVVVDQEQGASYDLWRVREDVLRGGGTVTATWGGRVDINGDGRLAPDMGTGSAAGLGIAGGIVRPDELIDGDIPHALYLSANCTNGTSVYPSTHAPDDGEKDCAGAGAGPNADAPALGQRFQLTYTDEQIAALDVPAHSKVLLRAMAHYGLIMMDTTPDPWHIDQESAQDRTALGLPDPGVTFARAAKLPYWAPGGRYLWELDQIPGLDGRAGSWTKALQVVQPCVSAGTCPLDGSRTPEPAPLWPVGSSTGTAPATTAPSVVSTATATATATVTVHTPAVATARAAATAQASARVPVRSSAKRSTAAHRKARKAARARAQRIARVRARTKARKAARARALQQARRRAAVRAAR